MKWSNPTIPAIRVPTLAPNMKVEWVPYPLRPLAIILLPFNFLAENIGKLIGVVLGLAVALIISPFLPFKSLFDKYQSQKENQESIVDKEEEIRDCGEGICKEVAKELISGEDVESILDLYSKLQERFPSEKDELFLSFTSKLEQLLSEAAETADYDYLLGMIYQNRSSERHIADESKNEYREKAKEHFEKIPENHPCYEDAKKALNIEPQGADKGEGIGGESYAPLHSGSFGNRDLAKEREKTVESEKLSPR